MQILRLLLKDRGDLAAEFHRIANAFELSRLDLLIE
jgi:hypothetical protein